MKLLRPVSLLLLAALLPLIVLSAALGAAWLHQQQRTMEQDALERVSHLSTLISRELASQIEILRALAQIPLLDGEADRNAFFETASRIQGQIPSWDNIVLSTPDGERLVDAPELVGGARGTVVDLESHVLAVTTQRPVIGGIRRGPRGHAAFAIRVPVLRNGRAIHILSAVVNPDAFRDLLFGGGVPEGWIVAIVDSNGNIVARTSGPASLVGEPASEPALAARARGMAEIYDGRTIDGGRSTVVAYRMLPDSRWSVHVGIPRETYREPLVRAAWLLGGGGAASLALVGVMLWLLAREMRHRRLEEAAREGRERLEALGRLTGGVAHDFNNLLMIVQGAAEIIRRRKHSAEQVVQIADGLQSTVERGAALTRQLLAFARRGIQEPVDLDLRQRAPELSDLLRKVVEAGTEVVVSVPEDTWPVYADPNALEVALINLAVNARDAMPHGGSLTVSARNLLLQGGRAEAGLKGEYVVLSVADTGIGIAAEHLDRIFEPFFTTKPSGKGTGLGLSQVFGFAKQSGGAVAVASKVGEGTTFTLYLPRSTRPVPEARPVRPAPAVDAGRILLVEDNHEVALAASEMLVSAGYEVVRADGAAQALGIIDSQGRFDAVLSDIMLEGGMSGLDLAPLIRRRRPDLPVVLMTGYSEALSRGERSGFTVLPKPFGRQQMVEALRAAGGAGAAGPAR